MKQFEQLLTILERELTEQERLLAVLTRERSAIARLNRDDLLEAQRHKEQLLEELRGVEGRRAEIVRRLRDTGEPSVRLKTLLKECSSAELRRRLEHAGDKLKQAAEVVRDLNAHNGELLRRSLGLVSSTLAIMRSAPGTELPTYGETGRLRTDSDPGFTRKTKTLLKDA